MIIFTHEDILRKLAEMAKCDQSDSCFKNWDMCQPCDHDMARDAIKAVKLAEKALNKEYST